MTRTALIIIALSLCCVQSMLAESMQKYLQEMNRPGLEQHQDWIRSRFTLQTQQLAELATFNNKPELAERIEVRAAKVLASDDGLIN